MFYNMFFYIFLSMFSCGILLSFCSSFLFQISFFSVLNSFNLNFSFELFTKVFFFSLVIIFLSVFLFSYYYQTESFDFVRFSMMVFSFVLSMILLIFHNNLFTLIMGWDGLGITSYFLVAYYNNWTSLNGALATVLTNRFGDFCIFWFLIYFLFSFNMSLWSKPFIVFIFILGAFTKSAQLPFSSWLPMAMSAPTPVSALVHSSTLVTAGIFLIFKYLNSLESKNVLSFLCLFGLMTMFLASVSGLIETDGKKIVALSTLSQLGFMVFSLGWFLPYLTFFHLISHAFFKSCMFIQIGNFIHLNFSNQDLRGNSFSYSSNLSISLFLLICLFSLSGFIFLSGFISKDFIMCFLFQNSINTLYFFLIVLSIFLTICYSFRLGFSIFSNLKLMISFKNPSFINNFCSFILILLAIFSSWWLMNNISFLPISFIFSEKLILLTPFILIFVFSWFCFKFFFSKNSLGIFNQDFMMKFSQNINEKGMVKIDVITNWVNLIFLNFVLNFSFSFFWKKNYFFSIFLVFIMLMVLLYGNVFIVFFSFFNLTILSFFQFV